MKTVKKNQKLVLISLDDYAPDIEVLEQKTHTKFRYSLDLAIPSIARVAKILNIPVVAWNEFFMGEYVPIEKIVDPGDIVGFSCLATGVNRLEELIRRSISSGASFIIGGGDAIQFRPQLALRKGFDAVVYRDGFKQIACLLKVMFFDNKLPEQSIWGVATKKHGPTIHPSNANVESLRADNLTKKDFLIFSVILEEYDRLIPQYFIIPFFEVYRDNWGKVVERVHKNFQTMFGDTFNNPSVIKSVPVSLGTGCTHTSYRVNPVCSFCSIAEVQNIGNYAEVEYLRELKYYYERFGFNTLFAVQPDGGYLFKRIPKTMQEAGFVGWELLEVYGRLQTIAQAPNILDLWKSVTKRLVMNSSFEAVGDLLQTGAYKATTDKVNIEQRHWDAIKLLRDKGVYLHTAFVFGLLGSRKDDYYKAIEAAQQISHIMGDYLYFLEGHTQWFSIGAPFTDKVIASYEFAKKEARKYSGLILKKSVWFEYFGKHKNSFVLPIISQEIGYKYFTHTTREEAERATSLLAEKFHGREFEIKEK